MNFDFSGRTILVTGGTRGIGRQVATTLKSLGGKIIITGTKDPGLEGFIFIKSDLSNINGINKFIENLRNIENIDTCFNCAGINRIDDIEDIDMDDFNSVMNTNLYAPFMISKYLMPIMKNNNYGRIVNVSSIWGSITKKGRTSYSVSKNGIIGLTRSLSVEGSDNNVIVNCISPGFTKTELTRNSLSEDEILELENKIPLKRMADPSEISNVVIFLLSDYNSYMTGQNIIVDGGFTIV